MSFYFINKFTRKVGIMKSFTRLKRKSINVFRMIKYAYISDIRIKGKKIKYGSNKKQCYKVYNSQHLNKPVIFFVHGGGWSQSSPSLYSGVGKFFLKRGYTTSLVGYRLVPKYTYPTQIEDAFLALKHYIDNNSNCTNIILAGYSAGAEIASRLAFDEYRQNKYNIDQKIINGFISISGVLDFNKCYSRYSKKILKRYLKDKSIVSIDPINIICFECNIPTLCIHGDKDSLISVDNSISFINKLSLNNNNTKLLIIEGADHEETIDMIRGNGNNYSHHILEFIDENS